MGIFIDPTTFPDDGYGLVQVLFLLVAYGFILSKSSALISDGSELLLLIPALAGIVGSIVLPVLGAVPDGAIVLFSGFGPDAQNQLSVGVGALAGSTIMLLTIPWALCIITGRVDIVNGSANYRGKPKLTKTYSLTGCGITPRPSIAKNGLIMIMTATAYLIIQGAAFGARCDLTKSVDCKGYSEHWWALAALLVTIIAFCAYMWYNIKHADDEDKEDFINEIKKQAIESHIISLSTAFEAALNRHANARTALIASDDGEKRFNDTLKSFFNKYDTNGNGAIEPVELKLLLKDVGEDMPDDRFNTLLKEIDTDGSGAIEFKEFAVAMRRFLTSNQEHKKQIELNKLSVQQVTSEPKEEEEDDESEEEESVPDDLASLPPRTQKIRILLRAGWMMGLGTAVTLLFSDPMVDVLNNLGTRLNISPFYVAFVLAPVASNASELIASINYATKKTKKTITISLAALEGAACMNNTFCLGIFLCLIFFRGLVWEFSAETISIIFVELALFAFARVKTHNLMICGLILSLYPISLFIVWFFENIVGLN